MADKIENFLTLFSSMNTRNAYRASLTLFFKSLYGEGKLEEQAERYFNEKRNYEEDVERFFVSIQSKPPKTVKLRLTVVKTFFIENNVELSDKFWRRLGKRVRGSRALTLDKVPSNQELKQILSHMTIQGKALFTLLASSGMRIGECLQLKPSDLEDGDPYRIKIRGEYTKSGNPRITFISKEAVLFLNEWMKVREDYLKSASGKGLSPIRVNRKEVNDERIFPFEEANAYYMWKVALNKSGFMKRDSSTNRITVHPHVLRKFFRTRLGAVIPVDIVESLMGHEGYLTDVYRRYSVGDLGKFYQQGEHTLTVFGSEEDVNKLREEISVRNKELQTLVNSLATENISLKNENISIKNRLNELEKELDDYGKEMDDVEKEVHEIMKLVKQGRKEN